jgi:hypothetical protein
MMIIFCGFGVALIYILNSLPGGIGLMDAAVVAGKMGKLNAVDFSFDLRNRYNFWSGLIGGFFVALSYFGTDQSQVGRYLTGRSIAESRTGLLANGIVKVPMQFVILFLGMVFVFYLSFRPVFFNPVEVERVVPAPTEPSSRGGALRERLRRARPGRIRGRPAPWRRRRDGRRRAGAPRCRRRGPGGSERRDRDHQEERPERPASD